MVARIAPSPIVSPVAIGDATMHATESTSTQAGQHTQSLTTSQPSAEPQHVAQIQPPTPPGEAFAAAVISGQLAPKPVTPEELRQRLGSSWQPPSSPLRLMDKIA